MARGPSAHRAQARIRRFRCPHSRLCAAPLSASSALAQALAEVGRPGAPVSVRIDYVILGPNTGNAGGPAGSSPDQMVGVVIIGGVARPLRALTSYYPAASDPATIERSNYDRVFQLSRAFAYWAARGYWGT